MSQDVPNTTTADEFAARVEKLVTETGEQGLSDEEMIKVLEDAAAALREGLT